MNKFEELIKELGAILHIPLEAENGIACKLNIEQILHVQLEYEESKQEILIASFLASIPAGKFREETLLAALKANHDIDSLGSFAYSDKNTMLALQLYLPISITAEELNQKLKEFIEKGKKWKEAVDQGRIELVSKPKTSSLASPFTLT